MAPHPRGIGDAKFKRRVKEASVVGGIDLDPDDFLCDFVGVVKELRTWALKVHLIDFGIDIWLQRQKTIVEERTDNSLIIHIPVSVVIEKNLSHEFLMDNVQSPVDLEARPVSDFKLYVTDYDEGIDDGYVG